MRGVIRNIVVLSLPTFIVVGLVLEVFLRLSGYTPYYLDARAFAASGDSRTVYELNPGFRGLYAGVPISINSLGFRGKESLNNTNEHPLRIVVVGDSVAFGQGVRDNQTLSAQLEDLVERKIQGSVEITNLGVPAYNTCQEYWRFKSRGLKLEPKIVVLVYVSNDTDPPTLQVIGGRVVSPDTQPGLVGEFMGSVRKSSFLYNIVWSHWQIIKAGGPRFADYRKVLARNFGSDSPGWNASKGCLADLASLTRSQDMRLIVIPFPILGEFSEHPYPFDQYIRTVCEATRAVQAECLDVVPDVSDPGIQLTVSSVERHPSVEVYSRVAKHLAAMLP